MGLCILQSMRSILLSFTTLFLVSISSIAQTFTPGSIHFGRNNYVEYRVGELPIIVAAPHGGGLTPSEIPDRNCSGCVTARDSRTWETSLSIDSAFLRDFGKRPHVIINHLHRKKLDANREIVEAAQGNQWAEQAWMEFHEFIEHASDSIQANFDRGLYLDMHGHAHSIPRVELGYLLTRSNLQLDNAIFNDSFYVDKSSVKEVAWHNSAEYSFAQFIRGETSMGELLEIGGYPTVPSKTDTAPHGTQSFFSGGYNTRRYGSRDSTTISAIQFELNWPGIRDTEANRDSFARRMVCACRSYMREFFLPDHPYFKDEITVFTSHIAPTSARLNWQYNFTVKHFELRGRSLNSQNWTVIPLPGAGPTNKHVAGLANGNSYEWQIRGFCDEAKLFPTPWSYADTFTTGCFEPDTLWTDPITSFGARLNWSVVEAVDGYRIRGQKTGNLNWVILDVGGGTTVSKDVFGLQSGSNYQWQVGGLCENGNIASNFSALTQFSTSSATKIGVGNREFSMIELRERQLIIRNVEADFSISPKIISMDGKVYRLHNVVSENGDLIIDVSGFPRGIYLVNWVNINGKIQSNRVVLP